MKTLRPWYGIPISLSLVLCAPASTTAQEPDAAALLDEARKIAAAIRLEVAGEGEKAAAELVSEPVLRFGDDVREDQAGTIWIWTRSGRPVALMELYFKKHFDRRVQVVASLTDRPLAAEGGDGFTWQPTAAGVEPKRLDGPQPARDAEARLRQMKLLARGFEGHQFWDPENSRYELRLLPQPVFRYAAPREGVVDGAIFLFAHGTNPEIALLLEARGPSAEAAEWSFAAARIGHAEMHLARNDADVWQVPRAADIPPTEPYYLFYLDGGADRPRP